MVESQPSKLLVAGPIPVSRSIFSNLLNRQHPTSSPNLDAVAVPRP